MNDSQEIMKIIEIKSFVMRTAAKAGDSHTVHQKIREILDLEIKMSKVNEMPVFIDETNDLNREINNLLRDNSRP